MKISVLTLFPHMFAGPMGESIIGRAVDNNLLELNIMNIRDYTKNKHKKVDDYPYGGGAGMVMQADPIFNALENIDTKNSRIIYMTPKGKVFNQDLAIELSKEEHIVFLCGHYEGVDQRVIDHWVTDEVSIGDYVLTGGELPAMVMIDSIARMIPGVLGQKVSYMDESIYSGLLEYPHYTRPSEYRDMPVPEVLLSGNHKRIEEWRMEKSLEITRKRRPDMYKKYKNL
ncbi:MAG: tRNA (guanosine(37)-N1)-methyltransferase TrmD [Anaeromicrobium sp.]|uniref:tRNA (guanosine(37)-N1)-methyltransferase TrmD n=1 Tax=Anaeromicrobium sp. TaxID=1929132 RepID=UPI0025F3128A|nr:tRNA (guanosine(37)-N1)-methyltransferase TrmD [Anaeromicrobium sp.]MCT4594864.1 tRNA (guanosine(37)-N1)-methyltransferase TrmD [Anaeromicrobium sp.]